ncbi:MAG: RHS repeat-associated core domain-containing protein [Bacteroidales bacterium]|jgi:RHS repeat-associated protein
MQNNICYFTTSQFRNFTNYFSNNGNIQNKSDVNEGDYQYDATKVNAVREISSGSGETNSSHQVINYNSFNKIADISISGPVGSNTTSMYFTYGPEETRKKVETKLNGNLTKTKYYTVNYEEEKDEATGYRTKWHYIMGGDGLAAIYIYNESNSTGTMYYVLKDHLGSITGLVNDAGTLVEEYSYDAWGRRRNVSDWSYNAVPVPTLVTRGYTGHEHLDVFGLINMNGRLYDPIVGRMLSPDNFVQDATSTQGFNRYSYCLNNPLKYTDPSGDFVQYIVGGIMGAISGYQYAESFGKHGKFWYALGGAIIGAASAGIGSGIASSGAFMANTFSIAFSSITYSAGMAAMTGGKMQPSISFGVASYNFGAEDWGYLGKKHNKWYETMGYAFGAMADLQDLVAGTHGTSIDVNARPKIAGHSQSNGFYDGQDITISVGPCEDVDPKIHSDLGWEWEYVKKSLKGDPAFGENVSYIKTSDPKFLPIKISNVNGKWLLSMTNRLNANRNLLNSGNLTYGLFQGCVNYNARALLFAGIFNINAFLPVTSPMFLNLELTIRQAGIYASPYLTTH